VPLFLEERSTGAEEGGEPAGTAWTIGPGTVLTDGGLRNPPTKSHVSGKKGVRMNGIENQIVATKCFQHSKGLNRKNSFPQAQTNTRRHQIFNNGQIMIHFGFQAKAGPDAGICLGFRAQRAVGGGGRGHAPGVSEEMGFALMWQSEPKRRIMRSGRLQNYTKILRICVKTRNHAILFELLISPL